MVSTVGLVQLVDFQDVVGGRTDARRTMHGKLQQQLGHLRLPSCRSERPAL